MQIRIQEHGNWLNKKKLVSWISKRYLYLRMYVLCPITFFQYFFMENSTFCDLSPTRIRIGLAPWIRIRIRIKIQKAGSGYASWNQCGSTTLLETDLDQGVLGAKNTWLAHYFCFIFKLTFIKSKTIMPKEKHQQRKIGTKHDIFLYFFFRPHYNYIRAHIYTDLVSN